MHTWGWQSSCMGICLPPLTRGRPGASSRPRVMHRCPGDARRLPAAQRAAAQVATSPRVDRGVAHEPQPPQ